MAAKRTASRAAAVRALKAQGITKKRLAKTTGTTKGEVTQMYRRTVNRLTTGGVQRKDTRAVRRALQGGPKAGVAKSAARTKRVKKQVTAVRKAVSASNKSPVGKSTRRKAY